MAEMEDKAPLTVRRYIFNQYTPIPEDDDSGFKELVAQKEVWAQSRSHAMNLVKKLHGKKFWYEYQGVEAHG